MPTDTPHAFNSVNIHTHFFVCFFCVCVCCCFFFLFFFFNMYKYIYKAKKKIVVFQVPCQKKTGLVGRLFFFFFFLDSHRSSVMLVP